MYMCIYTWTVSMDANISVGTKVCLHIFSKSTFYSISCTNLFHFLEDKFFSNRVSFFWRPKIISCDWFKTKTKTCVWALAEKSISIQIYSLCVLSTSVHRYQDEGTVRFQIWFGSLSENLSWPNPPHLPLPRHPKARQLLAAPVFKQVAQTLCPGWIFFFI